MKISQLTVAGAGAWNAYVKHDQEGTFFHLAEWKRILEDVYKLPTFYLFAECDGDVCAVLPLAYVKSRLFGNVLASTPFCVYGGVIGSDEESVLALQDRATDLARQLGADYLQLRNDKRSIDGWPCSDRYYSFEKLLHADHDKNMQAVPRKQRAMIRKGLGTGLAFERDTHIDRLYPIYATSVRNLGTPVYPRSYFLALKEIFGDRCLIHTVIKNAHPICSVLSFVFKNKILPYYAGGLDTATQLKAYDFMYWRLMSYACDAGVTAFDFGRSTVGSGAFSYKKNWGFEPRMLHYQYCLRTIENIPDMSPSNPKYRLLIQLWKQLPLSVANRLGPYLSRSLW